MLTGVPVPERGEEPVLSTIKRKKGKIRVPQQLKQVNEKFYKKGNEIPATPMKRKREEQEDSPLAVKRSVKFDLRKNTTQYFNKKNPAVLVEADEKHKAKSLKSVLKTYN